MTGFRPIFPVLACASMLVVCSCADKSGREMTTESPYTSVELRALEERVQHGDLKAARELEVHYSFSEDERNRKRMHQIRLKASDPEAMYNEATRIFLKAKRQPADREALLQRALHLSTEADRISKAAEPDRLVTKMLKKAIQQP